MYVDWGISTKWHEPDADGDPIPPHPHRGSTCLGLYTIPKQNQELGRSGQSLYHSVRVQLRVRCNYEKP